MEETAEQKAHLDNIVHSGVDALVLGCINQVGSITYRDALKQYKEKSVSVNTYLSFTKL